MTDWFRSWHGAPTDPKWLGIAKRAGVAPGIAAAVAWALMDRASQAADRGNVDGYDADGLGCFFGCEPEQVDAIVQAMTDKGMLVDGRFTAWEKRQPKREDDSTDRVREHRERKKAESKRTVTHCNAPDTDTDTDTDISSLRSDIERALDPILDRERVAALIDHRKRKRSPLTASSAGKLAKRLAEYHDPNAAVDEMQIRGWTGFKAEWMADRATGPPRKATGGNPFSTLALELDGHGNGTPDRDDIDGPGPSGQGGPGDGADDAMGSQRGPDAWGDNSPASGQGDRPGRAAEGRGQVIDLEAEPRPSRQPVDRQGSGPPDGVLRFVPGQR